MGDSLVMRPWIYVTSSQASLGERANKGNSGKIILAGFLQELNDRLSLVIGTRAVVARQITIDDRTA